MSVRKQERVTKPVNPDNGEDTSDAGMEPGGAEERHALTEIANEEVEEKKGKKEPSTSDDIPRDILDPHFGKGGSFVVGEDGIRRRVDEVVKS